MAVRWCFLGSHEIPEGAPTKMARGGSQICLDCAATERGQTLLIDQMGTEGYRANQTGKPRWQRAREFWLKGGKPSR